MDEISEELTKKLASIEKASKAAFLSSFLVGLLAHFFILSNALLYHDSAKYMMQSVGSTFGSGRWGLGILSVLTDALGIVSHTSTFDGIISLVFISFSSVLIVKLLDINSTLGAVFSGAILAVFPSVAATFAYMFTAAYYYFAFFLTTLSLHIYISHPSFRCFLLSAFMLSFSIGVYQVNLCFAGALVFAVLIIKFIYNKDSLKTCLSFLLRTILLIVVGTLIYFIVNKFLIAIMNTQVTTYQGMDTAGKINLALLPAALFKCYKSFLLLKWNMDGVNYGMNSSLFMRFLILALSLVAITMLFRDTYAKWKKKRYFGITLLLILLTPLAMDSVYLLSTSSAYWVHSLMLYPLVIYVILLVSIFDHSNTMRSLVPNARILKRGVSCVVILGLTIIPLQYCYVDNASYYRMALVQSEMNSWLTVLVSEIRGCDGYKDELPVAFIGVPGKQDSSIFSYPVGNIGLMGYTSSVRSLVSDYSLLDEIRIHVGYNPTIAEDTESLLNSSVVQNMPCYPDDGSIAIVDDTVVVKFSDE